MFTGIIEGLGTIKSIHPSGQGCKMTIFSDFVLERTKIGDSIAVNGACLTAVKIDKQTFEVDVSPETLSISTLGKAKIGSTVNIERALRLSDRLDGHIVSGHIDGMGHIVGRKNVSNAIIITIGVSPGLSRYMIKKGSVAVDGVSLTINNCTEKNFDVSIIPHTAKLTTVGIKKIGEPVNIETDMIGKYVEKFITKGAEGNNAPESSINMQFLAKSGFL